MSSLPLPPNPCLVAIILVVKTSSEPRIAFHYPPRPGEDNSHFRDMFEDNSGNDGSSSSSSDDDSQDSSTEAAKPSEENEMMHQGGSTPEMDEIGSASPEKTDRLKPDQTKSSWNDLFGFPTTVLAKALCPSASGHKKRFEVGFNGKVFLGRPVFARPDSTWRKPKRPRRSSSRSNITAEKVKKDQGREDALGRNTLNQKKRDNKVSEQDFGAENHSDTQQDGNSMMKAGGSEEVESAEDETDPRVVKRPSAISIPIFKMEKQLAMFNVVFVLQPPPLEYHLRVKEMYDNVTKKLSKALKWEQARSNYVATEAALISSSTKQLDRSREMQRLATLYHDLISQSSLARAISVLYNSLTASRIAHISLSPDFSLSLQIPIPTSISKLPTALSPQLSGLWLTTASSMPTADDIQATGHQLGAFFTLLLLSDLHSILADIDATAFPITGLLTHYLRVSKSTKSFLQISQSSGIPLTDIQFLASHLIYWRRARAIPPLHQRDIYIVSPNADMRDLASASVSFSKAFPALPPLSKILSMLSFNPRPYSTLIPSKDHKETYMEILGWLLRGGWVTQLRTFAWVRVPAHIKDTVTRTHGSRIKTSPETADGSDADSTSTSSSHLDVPLESRSPSLSPTSSTHTTLPINQDTSPKYPSLISNPRLASTVSCRYLSAISIHILKTQGLESQSAWDRCVNYFDGNHAIEIIPVREGWKRKRVAELMAGWEGLGVLVRGRHW